MKIAYKYDKLLKIKISFYNLWHLYFYTYDDL